MGHWRVPVVVSGGEVQGYDEPSSRENDQGRDGMSELLGLFGWYEW